MIYGTCSVLQSHAHSIFSQRAAINCVNGVWLKLQVKLFARCVVHAFPFESCFRSGLR